MLGVQRIIPVGGGKAVNPNREFNEPCTLDPRLIALREDLIGELQAINQYQIHAMEAADPNHRALFCHTMNDEKHHVAEFMSAIMMIDPVQRHFMMQAMGHMPGMGGPGSGGGMGGPGMGMPFTSKSAGDKKEDKE
jgi:hypothetical protein